MSFKRTIRATTRPTITESISKSSTHTASNGTSCYSSVAIDPNCSDSLSGFYRYTKGNGNFSYLSVGMSRTRSVTCQDQAGNSTSKTYGPYNICTNSKHSSCGYATCRTSACGCETTTCNVYNDSISKCGCASWGSTTEKMVSNNKDPHTYPPGCRGITYSPTSWVVAKKKKKRTRYVYKCEKLQTNTAGEYGFFTYKQTQTCKTGKRCSAAGCESSSCAQYYSCKTSACGYASCYHY